MAGKAPHGFPLARKDLAPNRDTQAVRTVMPRQNPQWEWRRSGLVLTLGELFVMLGEDYNAAQIYYFFRTLCLVAVKRRKGVPGSASKTIHPPATGTHHAGVKASMIKRELLSNKEQLVEEYAAVTQRTLPGSVNEKMLCQVCRL